MKGYKCHFSKNKRDVSFYLKIKECVSAIYKKPKGGESNFPLQITTLLVIICPTLLSLASLIIYDCFN